MTDFKERLSLMRLKLSGNQGKSISQVDVYRNKDFLLIEDDDITIENDKFNSPKLNQFDNIVREKYTYYIFIKGLNKEGKFRVFKNDMFVYELDCTNLYHNTIIIFKKGYSCEIIDNPIIYSNKS